MAENHKTVAGKGVYISLAALLNGIVVKQAFVHNAAWYWLLLVSLPLLITLIFDCRDR